MLDDLPMQPAAIFAEHAAAPVPGQAGRPGTTRLVFDARDAAPRPFAPSRPVQAAPLALFDAPHFQAPVQGGCFQFGSACVKRVSAAAGMATVAWGSALGLMMLGWS